ncbi:MAG: hypothetical protein V3W44_04215 [Dehalococcoidales bacterium]
MKPIRTLLILLLTASIAFGTVNDDYVPSHTLGNGSTTTFSVTWGIAETSDVVVLIRTVATGAEEDLVETTDYSISAVNNDLSAGFTVTTVATYTSASKISILRAEPATQNSNLTESESGTLREGSLEDAYDKLTRLYQQLAEENDRQITIPRSDDGITVELDDSISRASMVLGFDSAGNVTALESIPEGSVSISAYMQTVNAAATADAAKTLLEIPTITAFAETYLDDATAAATRTTLGAVGLTGDETVAGAKTFSSAAVFSVASTLADSSQLASSAAPTADADISNKKYSDDQHLPYARMYPTAAQENLTDVTWTIMVLDTDEFDSGTITDTANYDITPAVAGQYMVIGQITYTNTIAEKTYYAQLYFNGSAAKTIASAHTGAATTDVTVSVCDVIVFDSNDYVSLRGQVNAGVNTVDINVGSTDTFLALYRL